MNSDGDLEEKDEDGPLAIVYLMFQTPAPTSTTDYSKKKTHSESFLMSGLLTTSAVSLGIILSSSTRGTL
jgi:hypothetical protein